MVTYTQIYMRAGLKFLNDDHMNHMTKKFYDAFRYPLI